MAALVIVFFIAYVSVVGYAWRQVTGRFSSVDGIERLAWNFGVGTVLYAYALFLVNLVGIRLTPPVFYSVTLALLLLPLVLNRQGKSPTASPEEPSTFSFFELAALALLAVATGAVILQAITTPMVQWDSIVLYGFKAKILFTQWTFRTVDFLDPTRFHQSVDYPLLVPYLEAGYYRWLSVVDDRWVRLLFVTYWLAWLLIVNGALRGVLGRQKSVWMTTWIGTLPLFSGNFMGQASSGFVDIPLAFYWTAFLSGLVRALSSDSSRIPWDVMLMGLGCMFVKVEGLPLVATALVLLLIVARPIQRKHFLPSVAVTGSLVVPWLIGRHLLPHNAAHYWRWIDLSWSGLTLRLSAIAHGVNQEWWQFSSWGIFWALAISAFIVPATARPIARPAKFLMGVVFVQFLIYGYVYAVYPQNLDLLLPITVQRLLIHCVGPILLAAAWRFRELKTGNDAPP